MQEIAKARAMDLKPIINALQQQGVSTAIGLAQALNARGISAPEGGQWQATQVLRLIKRLSKGD